MGAGHAPHERIERPHSGGIVLRPRKAVGLPRAGVDVRHGEQHHSCTEFVEDGDCAVQVARQVAVPGGLAHVDPAAVELVVRHLPAAEAECDHLGVCCRGHERPPRPPRVAPGGGVTHCPRHAHEDLRVEVATEGGIVVHGHSIGGLRANREAHAQGHGDGVAEDQEPDGMCAEGARPAQSRPLRRAEAQRRGLHRPRPTRRPCCGSGCGSGRCRCGCGGRARRDGRRGHAGRAGAQRQQAGSAQHGSRGRSDQIAHRPLRRRAQRAVLSHCLVPNGPEPDHLPDRLMGAPVPVDARRPGLSS